MRPLLLLLSLAGLCATPAVAQFQVIDPATAPPPDLPQGAAPTPMTWTDYNWELVAFFPMRTATHQQLLTSIEMGQPKTGFLPSVVHVSRWGLAGGTLVLTNDQWRVMGDFHDAAPIDFNGDGVDELLLRVDHPDPAPQQLVPFTGGTRTNLDVPGDHETLVAAFGPEGAAATLLSNTNPGTSSENWTLLPTTNGSDLLLATFGGNLGGASPDAYLRFSYAVHPGGPVMQREADLVLPPVPITQMATADLDGSGTRTVVSVREIIKGQYKNQLWAQTLHTGGGFFDNAPIGQGEQLQLLSPAMGLHGLTFCWQEVKSKPPVTHIATIRLDVAGKPLDGVDLPLPWQVAMRTHTTGHWWGSGQTPGYALLIEPPSPQPAWLALVRSDSGGWPASLELRQYPAIAHWTVMTAMDLNGDGRDDLVGSDGVASGWLDLDSGSFAALTLPSRTKVAPVSLLETQPSKQPETEFTFALEPERPD